MDEQKTGKSAPAPQLKVRSGATAGASVEACLDNLYYWQNEYYKRCGGAKPTPYTQ
jgi:hypothetical protein